MITQIPIKSKHLEGAHRPSEALNAALSELLPHCVFQIGSDSAMIYDGHGHETMNFIETFGFEELAELCKQSRTTDNPETVLDTIMLVEPYKIRHEDIEYCSTCHDTGQGATPDLPCPDCQRRKKRRK